MTQKIGSQGELEKMKGSLKAAENIVKEITSQNKNWDKYFRYHECNYETLIERTLKKHKNTKHTFIKVWTKRQSGK